MSQLRLCQDLQFNSASVLTLGPKLGPHNFKVEIAADFHVGISRLVRAGVLDGESAFPKQALSTLQSFIDIHRPEELVREEERSVPFPSIKEKPSTPIEKEIYEAMKVALDF
jgi:hypothetical protein